MKRSTRILLILIVVALAAFVVVAIVTQPAIDGANQAAADFFTRQAP